MDKVENFHHKCHMSNICAKYDTCPMTLFHKLVSGKWKILILWYLSDGSLRFSEIKRKLPEVTQKMLTNQNTYYIGSYRRRRIRRKQPVPAAVAAEDPLLQFHSRKPKKDKE